MTDIHCSHDWRFIKEDRITIGTPKVIGYLFMFHCKYCRKIQIDGYETNKLKLLQMKAME